MRRRSTRRAAAVVALAAILAGCAAGPETGVFGFPTATVVPVRLIPCPAPVPAAARATGCPAP